MVKRYKNTSDGLIYTIEDVPVKTKEAFGWVPCGTAPVLKNNVNNDIYLVSSLSSASYLWKEIK